MKTRTKSGEFVRRSLLLATLTWVGMAGTAQADPAWTAWLNRDVPSGAGDWETRADFPGVCATPRAVEGRVAATGVAAWQSGEVLQISPEVGLVCRTADQPDGACLDYEVRFDCGTTDSYAETTVAGGSQWRLVQVTGTAVDDANQPFNTGLFMIDDASGISNAPLPESVRQDLLAAVDNSMSYVVSEEVANEIELSEQLGYLTPTLAAIAEPYEEEPLPLSGTSDASAAEAFGLFGRCSDKINTKSKSFNVSTPLTEDFDLGSGFSGNVSLTGDATFAATGQLETATRRFKLFGACIPYGVAFRHVRAFGNAQVNLGTTLSGTVSYTNSWEFDIAKPHLFSFTFVVAIIPVHIGFNLPITAGLELSASATGSVTYTGSQQANGTFDYTCTSGGCSGSSNITTTAPMPQPATAGISGRIQPSVWAQAAVRGYLYSDSFAYAQVGVKPYLRGDLWAYYGNNCSDANADNVFETVDAVTFDLDYQIYLTAQADTFFTSTKKWTLKDFGRKHINFWDLDTSDAITPVLGGSSSVPVSSSQPYTAKMRSCWPYTDNVTYRLGWGDGTTNTVSGAPQTPVSVSHTWSSVGAKTLDLSALSDAHGRNFGTKTTLRTIQVTGGNVNLAIGATATAQSTFSGYSPARVNDGSRNTTVGGAYSWTNAHTSGTDGRVPQWLQLDFGVNKTFSRVDIYTSTGYIMRDYDVQYWNGTSWVTLVTVTGNTLVQRSHTFASTSARLVRIYARSGSTSQPWYVRVNEFEVY